MKWTRNLFPIIMKIINFIARASIQFHELQIVPDLFQVLSQYEDSADVVETICYTIANVCSSSSGNYSHNFFFLIKIEKDIRLAIIKVAFNFTL